MNRSKGFAVVASAIAGVLLWGNGASTTDVQAAQTQLSTVPVAGTGQAVPKPNVMLLMDTSRSMAFTHMPDELEFPGGNPSYEMPIGYRSAQCNALYYDPAKVYEVPRGADGYYLVNPPTNVDFGAARYDFYSSGTANTNLATSFRAYDRNTRQLQIANDAEDPAQPAYYYTYEGTQALRYDAAPCTDMESLRFAGVNLTQPNVTASTTGGLWRRKLVSSSSGTGAAGVDERRNFATWYTFYRTRMAMVKSSISLAFNPINDGFRVGLVSMNPLLDTTNADSGVNPTKYLAIDDFNDTQKAAWYAKLYGQTPDGSSPAREGLARVGRHYAGRADGINANMTPDPVRYTCQQNFTIMTTDGYWNTAQETRGPVAIDGTTRVGNQDGNLTSKTILDRFDPLLYTHRPIWDGTTSGSRTDTTTSSMNRYQPCDSGEFFRTSSIVSRSTSQPTQRTQSLTKTTEQIYASTVQTSRSTTQDQKTTATETRQSLQALASTQQLTRATRQESTTTSYWGRFTRKVYATTTQQLQTTSYTQKTVAQIQTRTRTQTMSQTRQWQTQQKTTMTATQLQQSTSQTFKTDTLTRRSTNQPLVTRTYQMQSTRQEFQRTAQTLAYNGATESTTPVASCTNSGNITCLNLTTGPTAVASCSPQSPNSGNNFVTRTCDAPTTTGPTAVQTCTPQSAVQGNNYTSTTCAQQVTGPTPAASCSNASPSASNGWANVTCSANTTGPTSVASCTPGTDGSFVTTTCNVTPTTTAVSSCTPGTNSSTQVVTTCNTTVTGPTGVASCTPSGPTSSNSYLTTTCASPPATSFTATKAACVPASAAANNNYTTTTCSTAITSPRTAVASCTAGGGASPNFIETVCDVPAEQIATNQPVANCTASNPVSGNGFVRTTCGGATYSAWSNAASCTAQSPDGTNGFLERQCRDNAPVVTQVLPAQCVPGTTGTGVKTTCQAIVLPDVPVSSCTPNTTGPSFVSCRTVTTPETLVASCTPGGNASTNWVITSCRNDDTPEQNVGTCTAANAGSGNGNTATFCNFHTTTVPSAPGACAPQTGNSGNNWVTISCPVPATTGPTGVPLGSCTNAAASGTNAWTQTICTMNGPTTPVPVASCTGGTNPTDFTVTTCSTNNTPVTSVAPGSCTAQTASSTNGYTTVNCVPNTRTLGVAAGSCVAQTPTSGNSFTQISCNTVTTGPTFVAQGTCTAGTSGTFVTTSCNTVNTGPALVAACTNGTDANFKVTSCTVNTSQPQQLTPGSACTTEAPTSANNFTRTTCTANDTTVGVAADTCVPSPRGVLPVVSCATAVTNPTPVEACTPGIDSSFLTTTCTADTQGPDRVTSCSAVAPTASNGFRSTTCVAITGTKVQRRTQTITATYDVSGDTAIDSSARNKTTTETDWADASVCYASPASPPVVDTSGEWGATTTAKGPVTGSGLQGSIDSLADVAQYYYVTDLRPSLSDDIPRLGEGIEDDRAPWQHMTTFVVGLGVSGNLNYQENYKSATTGDFSKIRSYENTPPVNWPIWPNGTNLSQLQYNDPRSIDDFWHAAVNGRGKYFSARDPQSVVDGLKEALSGIKAQAGAGAGASTSSLTPTAGDNIAYTASFTTLDWTGEVQAQELDTTTGSLSTTVRWSARGLLDAKVGDDCDNRKIYARDPASNALVDFSWNTKACDTTSGLPTGNAGTGLSSAMQGAFTASGIATGLSQYPFMSDGSSGTIDQRGAVTGANLVNYLRGQRKREGYVYNTVKLYRPRAHVLGDIVNSQPAYVKAPSQFYQDAGYDTFKNDKKARTPMVYVGANDGMMHAFYAPVVSSDPNYANAGQEAWAYVPQQVMGNLWKLADTNYSDKHQFFVDGSPTAGDIFTGGSGGQWKTMVVAGLGHGGSGYYALDVTDPTAPRAMWEFNLSATCANNPVGQTADCNVGLTYGRPIITKLRDGTWVVLVTSGYNNTTPGDGRGYLYVLNASTGAIIQRIATTAGDAATPSGLRELNIFVSNYTLNNTAERAYGADLMGNVWRFDINNVIPPTGNESTLLATAKDKSNNAQPITTRPELAEVNGTTMVLVATGRLLSTDDLTDTSAQTVYGFQDALLSADPPNAVYSDLRTQLRGLALVQTGSGSSATRTVQCAATGEGACTQTRGWYIDLPDGGERVNVDMQSVLGTLVFASNVPSNTMCSGGGYSWLNFVDLITGEPVSSSGNRVTSVQFFGNSVVVGLGIIGLPDGTFRALGRDASGNTRSVPIPVGSPPPQGKRISWRELVR